MTPLSRRAFLLAPSFTRALVCAQSPGRYRTPYKLGKLVIEASTDPSAFDAKSADCPFVFHHDGRFYMTYVGFDGTGYQTGLASSSDLIAWKKLGCIGGLHVRAQALGGVLPRRALSLLLRGFRQVPERNAWYLGGAIDGVVKRGNHTFQYYRSTRGTFIQA